MFRIQTYNKISTRGLDLLTHDKYEIASEFTNPDAILLRSYKLHDMEFPPNLKVIARAGAGVNNIPVEQCTERGIVVFNTPGANANSVKELVIAGLLLVSRNIPQGIAWAKTLAEKGDEVPKLIEKGKSNFAGREIAGKKLGVIGLGAIGVMVANAASDLGMEVRGFDPFISVDSAWGLSRNIRKAVSLDALIGDSDYISIHVPLNDKTKQFLNSDKFTLMKPDTTILNFARGGLVDHEALKEAIKAGKVAGYVTDFPDKEILGMEEVVAIPHLGASTEEAEENCAVMAVEQLMDYLELGTIRNSVNFPDCSMEIVEGTRILVANRNIPNMVGQITGVLAKAGVNISDMMNRNCGNFAFNIIDVDPSTTVGKDVTESLKQIEGVTMVRTINGDENGES